MKRTTLFALLCCAAGLMQAQDPRERYYYYEILEPRHEAKPQVEGFAQERIQERLNRGLSATPSIDGKGLYLSWRLLDSDQPTTTFHLYREANGKSRRLTGKALSQTCDFTDAAPVAEATYWVEAVN